MPGDLHSALLTWYQLHKRRLPWRGEADPYKVLLSEVLLQQTRVEQAIPYYRRFLQQFPTLEALAQANQEDVLKAWQGCGYYARARNLHKLARQVMALGIALPKSSSELRALPGIGPYTAAAVASIAFGEPVAAVDGNVRRVLSRLYAWEHPTPKQVQEAADTLMAELVDWEGDVNPPDGSRPGDWNQALMELGATVCTPQSPSCGSCPVAQFCRGKNHPERYPAAKKRKQASLEVVALVLQGPSGIHLEPRQGRVLGGLWGIPMEEGAGALERLLARFRLGKAEPVGTVRHDFTHRKLYIRVYWAPWKAGENPAHRPLSRLDRKILKLVETERLQSLCSGN
ncbi:A/G-specific adenine glycosylase [Meiothermus sp.]|jgi:A/G-specific adenine glycosylase|uniref:A/G-specific adenine glycosylase n=1 Tax=Meiothermus sp. TaxID=1955249 RepID=UPI0021DD69FD|nr:A/G-specific adenine glycosylase [Meiothermus sp.]GIW25530.1 MAG: A/G-specific adenine glycosylase [Meiothermus sp.]